MSEQHMAALEAARVEVAQVWESLSPGWVRAFDEAWASWCEGSLGIGAALVDPDTNEIVASGRNRVNQTQLDPRTLSGNFMAHAEMNTFAAMDRFKADGLDLYTTLEPCLMCSATAIFMHAKRVFFASSDEYFSGLGELWDQFPYSQRNKYESIGPLDSKLAAFARVVPLSAQAPTSTSVSVMAKANDDIPTIAALAVELSNDGTLESVRAKNGTTIDAITALWPRLSPVAT